MGTVGADGKVITVKNVIAAHRQKMVADSFKPVTEVEALGDLLEQHGIDGRNIAKLTGYFVTTYGMSRISSGQEKKRGSGER